MTLHPEVLWSQRSSVTEDEKNIIYLTINLSEIQESTLEYDLKPSSISFKARAGNAPKGIEEHDYAFALDFFAEVIPEQSKKSLTTRSLNLVLRKKENQAEYWPRLTKEKVKNAFLKTDFSKWVDEDEQEGAAVEETEDMDPMGGMGGPPGMGGMGGMPGMGGMGGMPGMGGMGGGMPGGMDFAKMMEQMGGMGGGAGGMPDFSSLGGAGGSGAEDDDSGDDSDDDGPPPLESADPVA